MQTNLTWHQNWLIDNKIVNQANNRALNDIFHTQ